VHRRRAKREALAITRRAAQKGRGEKPRSLKRPYRRLLGRIERIQDWAALVACGLAKGIASHRYSDYAQAQAEVLVEQIAHFQTLAGRVRDQARRRVLEGESVPNDEKLFSLFEPHTELLKRGKAGHEIEFGHMIQLHQVGQKFITGYDVYDRKPIEPALLQPALARHRDLFGAPPCELSADKGYYQSMEVLHALERTIEVVSIAKKGPRTEKETARERDPHFRHAQAFRAGIEGTISFLKRVLRLARCFNKSWAHYVATVGQTIFAHNLLVLARV
jgi:IS5 family transposase